MIVLDLFCGLGGFSSVFRERGHRVIGVDIVPPCWTPFGSRKGTSRSSDSKSEADAVDDPENDQRWVVPSNRGREMKRIPPNTLCRCGHPRWLHAATVSGLCVGWDCARNDPCTCRRFRRARKK